MRLQLLRCKTMRPLNPLTSWIDSRFEYRTAKPMKALTALVVRKTPLHPQKIAVFTCFWKFGPRHRYCSLAELGKMPVCRVSDQTANYCTCLVSRKYTTLCKQVYSIAGLLLRLSGPWIQHKHSIMGDIASVTKQ